MRGKWTPGPLSVEQEGAWPFRIRLVDASGATVETFDRYAHSSKQNSLDDMRAAVGFSPADRADAIAANERQLADITLRAAAPALYEALEELREAIVDGLCNNGTPAYDGPERLHNAIDAAEAALSLAHPPSNHTEESKP